MSFSYHARDMVLIGEDASGKPVVFTGETLRLLQLVQTPEEMAQGLRRLVRVPAKGVWAELGLPAPGLDPHAS